MNAMRGVTALLAVATAALLVVGCDPLYGVSRDAELGTPPELECVRHAIESTDGIASVTYHASHEGKGLFHTTPWVYDYVYKGPPDSAVMGAVQLSKDYMGHFTYRNDRLSMGRPEPQPVIDATRPVMRAMEKNIARQCGVTELAAGVREDCTGVRCSVLPE